MYEIVFPIKFCINCLQTSESGVYVFHRLWMEWGNIHFALTSLNPLFSFVVSEELPAVSIKPESGMFFFFISPVNIFTFHLIGPVQIYFYADCKCK